jgi:hypothetical protein
MVASGVRPAGVTALSLFFWAGALISFTSSVSLLFQGSFLEPMWRLNPRARVGFATMGGWAVVLLSVVCLACALTALGLWRGSRWGYWFAVVMLLINLIGDASNVILRTEPRAAIGIPIVLVILWFLLSKRVRAFFSGSQRSYGALH